MATGARKEDKNEKLIRAISKLKENKTCINCNTLVPQYVCTNFWTFVCLTCSGIHREFTHRVKSISMCKFTAAEVGALNAGGNHRARNMYLANWDFQRNSLPNCSNIDTLRCFIKEVYVDMRYVARNTMEDYGRFSIDSRCRYKAGEGDLRSSSYNEERRSSISITGNYTQYPYDYDGGFKSISNRHQVDGDGEWGTLFFQTQGGHYAGKGARTFSHKSEKINDGLLLDGNDKHIHVPKYASVCNGSQAKYNLAVLKRADSDSLIELGKDDSNLAKGTCPDRIAIQKLSSVNETWLSPVNEGWATFDVHSPVPQREVMVLSRDPLGLLQISDAQTLESRAIDLPVPGNTSNGSLVSQPSYPHCSLKETSQQNPFSSTAYVEDLHQSGCRWEPYNISTSTSDSTCSSDSWNLKESCSSIVQQRKSKNPFDIPEEYVPSSNISTNGQFPSMDTLHMALPVLDSFPPVSLQSEWAPTEINKQKPLNSSAVAEYCNHMPVNSSSTLQVATLGHAMVSVNLDGQLVGSAIPYDSRLQLPVQSPIRTLCSSNPFE
ncbi:uncharacterized protein LOC131060146 isoform X2 [Cryptomeria japonica]|uniref:uncharacterized protein LOC131060146 isoform X2 n=1 Tax=Cryptomeria japonica TaxID=3369 RepID=UPI0027D9E644|nr:uncharacterized protein LOC131060146 isoform X2 [Cryptomeria japonica]